MSYEATISSYGGNTAVMAKSFVMAVKNVAQTWYSSLWPGTIRSWQKLKDMLITSFQGFQTKPVTAQTLFQCTQDHEEYLQAYVWRFLRLRAQAPTVPNKIVIEAIIKGLRPGPTAQYFARKPPQTLEKLLQKMDGYIRADNDFRQRREEAYRFSEMTRGFWEHLEGGWIGDPVKLKNLSHKTWLNVSTVNAKWLREKILHNTITTKSSTQRRHSGLSRGSAKYKTCLLHVVASQRTRVALNSSQVIQW
jgi:hypothetical protein